MWHKLRDDVVLAMGVRAFSSTPKLVSPTAEDDPFWLTGKPLQYQMRLKLARPSVPCFMNDHDFALMLTKLSDNSFKSLDDSVKKLVIARCGDDFDPNASKTALAIQAIKSKNKFLAS